MPHSGQNVRFQVLVNGEVRGTAGLDAAGVMSVTMTWVRRDPAAAPADARAAPDFSEDEWVGNRTDVQLGGLDSVNRRILEWLDIDLAVGDEVTVRVLPPGEFDPPGEINPSAASPEPDDA